MLYTSDLQNKLKGQSGLSKEILYIIAAHGAANLSAFKVEGQEKIWQYLLDATFSMVVVILARMGE